MVNWEKMSTFLPWDLSLGRSLDTSTILPEEAVRSSRLEGIVGGGGGAGAGRPAFSAAATASAAAFSAAASIARLRLSV